MAPGINKKKSMFENIQAALSVILDNIFFVASSNCKYEFWI